MCKFAKLYFAWAVFSFTILKKKLIMRIFYFLATLLIIQSCAAQNVLSLTIATKLSVC